MTDPPSTYDAAPGLRERKKLHTREAIAASALELFARQGFEQTTLRQVAEASDVAQRTVSLHYPVKEQLAFPHAEQWIANLARALDERPSHVSALEALRGWIESELPQWWEHNRERRIAQRVVESSHALLAYQQYLLAEVGRLIAGAIASDMQRPPDDIEPRLAAAATVAILGLLGEYELRDERAPTLAAYQSAILLSVDRAIAFVAAGTAALVELESG